LYDDTAVIALTAAARAYADATHERLELPERSDGSMALLDLLPPDGKHAAAAHKLAQWVSRQGGELPRGLRLATADVELLVPIPQPNKLLLLAGNYAKHIEEGGGMAAERAETFPYVFMKPPTTTLTDPGRPVVIPAVSPNHVDWEVELAVVIGRRCKGVKEADALRYVAGYTVVNDISHRVFRPNPGRKKREKDTFFDWLHGKWFDSFCPCGPCIASASTIGDPQKLSLKLTLNGQVKQNSTTALQIFPVAAVIEFISNITTLEPGDIISTGTPDGVGHPTGTYLKPGDRVEASISGIGTLHSPVVAEATG
jgi:2-keto-4-pentenoate hydratase/2-oxohepta-3-ene-1,7-dioic acid hydratase in catechol pathway